MSGLFIPDAILTEIHKQAETSYPEEGAGFLLGLDGGLREVQAVYMLSNAREDSARHNRYLITARDYMKGEKMADQLGLMLIGVFHSHPDHPNRPSEFDREWAQPWFSYVITSVESGRALESRSWRLSEDRESFEVESIVITRVETTGN
jgi:proteasome lid subunit RPN8/RPN11